MENSEARIGIVGGTFDPPHFGHLQIAKAAIAALSLEEVLFLPAFKNPLKSGAVARPEQRLEMVKRLIQGEADLAASDIEITRRGPSYSVDTVAELQFVRPARYWFILGSDALKDVPQWKSPERLFRLCRLAVVNRDSRQEFAFPNGFPDQWRTFVDLVPMKINPASSTEVRDRLAQKRDLSTLAPAPVLSYIREHHLYES